MTLLKPSFINNRGTYLCLSYTLVYNHVSRVQWSCKGDKDFWTWSWNCFWSQIRVQSESHLSSELSIFGARGQSCLVVPESPFQNLQKLFLVCRLYLLFPKRSSSCIKGCRHGPALSRVNASDDVDGATQLWTRVHWWYPQHQRLWGVYAMVDIKKRLGWKWTLDS